MPCGESPRWLATISGQAANRYDRSLSRLVLLASGAPQKGCKEEPHHEVVGERRRDVCAHSCMFPVSSRARVTRTTLWCHLVPWCLPRKLRRSGTGSDRVWVEWHGQKPERSRPCRESEQAHMLVSSMCREHNWLSQLLHSYLVHFVCFQFITFISSIGINILIS